jgi:hypothetical protein
MLGLSLCSPKLSKTRLKDAYHLESGCLMSTRLSHCVGAASLCAQIAVRSEDLELSQLVADCIR